MGHLEWKCVVFLCVTFWCQLGVTSQSCPGASLFIKRNGFKPPGAATLIYNSSTPGVGITLQCFNSCSNRGCPAFYIDYDVNACYSLPSLNVSSAVGQATILQSAAHQAAANVNYFQRVCVPAVLPACRVNLWTLDVVVGYRLDGYDALLYANVSVYDCAALCQNVTAITCRSAAFWSTDSSGLGQCQLSKEDRRTQSDAYRAVPDEVVYLENQCIRPQSGACSLNDFPNSTLASYRDVTVNNLTLAQCEQRCLMERRLVCRGYSYLPGVASPTEATCQLHSDDSVDLGPAAIVAKSGSFYRERVACLDLFVHCNATFLNVTLLTSSPFTGTMYARDSAAASCKQDGNSTTITSLLLSVVTTPASPSCGTVKTTLDNSTGVTAVSRIASSVIVVQFNSIVQTASDRTVRVSCNIDAGPPTDKPLSTNLTVNIGNGNTGVTNVTVDGTSGLPTVQLRIIDLGNGSTVTNQTIVGEKLQFRIDTIPPNSPYDVLVVNLTAADVTKYNSVSLLDSAGCPTVPNLFPALYKDADGNYASNFSAFRITNSTLVRFNLTVHFCEVACQAIVCSGPRPRRDGSNQSHVVIDQSQTESNLTDQSGSKVPRDMVFQFDLLVEDKPRPERKILGRAISENATELPTLATTKRSDVVATMDDYVCLQYATFLGLVFGWASLQVILFISAFFLVRWQLKRQDDELRRKLEDDLNTFDDLQRRVHWHENIEAVAAT